MSPHKRLGQQQKLGISFHRSFPLSRPSLTQVMEAAEQVTRGGKAEFSLGGLREQTSLGTVYVEAMPRYARAVGLLDEDNRLTRFGRLAREHDPGLDKPETQWAMHYHLVAPHGCGPAFWHHLVTTCLRPGDTLDSKSLVNVLAAFLAERGEPALSPEGTLRPSATVFLGTYAKSDALGGLGILRAEAGEGFGASTAYVVADAPTTPPVRVVAYALADYWRAVWDDDLGVRLSELSGPNSLAALLLLSGGEMNQILRELQSAGLVELQRKVPPFQVFRRWPDAATLLDGLYAD